MSAREALIKFKKTILPPSIWIAGRECMLDIQRMDNSIEFLFSRDILGISKEQRESGTENTRIREEGNLFSRVFGEKLQEDTKLALDPTEYPIIKKGLLYYLEESRSELVAAVREGDESKMAELDRRVRNLTVLIQRLIRINESIVQAKKKLPPTHAPKRVQELIRKFGILLLSAEREIDSGVSKENEEKVIHTLDRVANKDETFKNAVNGADPDSLDLFEIGLDGMEPFKRAYLYIYLGNYLDRIKKNVGQSSLPNKVKFGLLNRLDKMKDGSQRGVALQIDELFDRILNLRMGCDDKIQKLTNSLEDLLQHDKTPLKREVDVVIKELKEKIENLKKERDECKDLLKTRETSAVVPPIIPVVAPTNRINTGRAANSAALSDALEKLAAARNDLSAKQAELIEKIASVGTYVEEAKKAKEEAQRLAEDAAAAAKKSEDASAAANESVRTGLNQAAAMAEEQKAQMDASLAAAAATQAAERAAAFSSARKEAAEEIEALKRERAEAAKELSEISKEAREAAADAASSASEAHAELAKVEEAERKAVSAINNARDQAIQQIQDEVKGLQDQIRSLNDSEKGVLEKLETQRIAMMGEIAASKADLQRNINVVLNEIKEEQKQRIESNSLQEEFIVSEIARLQQVKVGLDAAQKEEIQRSIDAHLATVGASGRDALNRIAEATAQFNSLSQQKKAELEQRQDELLKGLDQRSKEALKPIQQAMQRISDTNAKLEADRAAWAADIASDRAERAASLNRIEDLANQVEMAKEAAESSATQSSQVLAHLTEEQRKAAEIQENAKGIVGEAALLLRAAKDAKAASDQLNATLVSSIETERNARLVEARIRMNAVKGFEAQAERLKSSLDESGSQILKNIGHATNSIRSMTQAVNISKQEIDKKIQEANEIEGRLSAIATGAAAAAVIQADKAKDEADRAERAVAEFAELAKRIQSSVKPPAAAVPPPPIPVLPPPAPVLPPPAPAPAGPSPQERAEHIERVLTQKCTGMPSGPHIAELKSTGRSVRLNTPDVNHLKSWPFCMNVGANVDYIPSSFYKQMDDAWKENVVNNQTLGDVKDDIMKQVLKNLGMRFQLNYGRFSHATTRGGSRKSRSHQVKRRKTQKNYSSSK